MRAEPPEQEHGAIGRLSADEELQQAVCNALIQEPELDSTELEVRAAGGVVTLTGSVRSRADWLRALRIARDQTGAQAVDAEQLHIDDG
jgi:osmotically-inducible protein OsmY